MNYKDRIIMNIAEHWCRKIMSRVIRDLQSLTDCLQSGDDSPLKNIWDEVCVQVQKEESFFWELYLHTIRQCIESEIEKLDVTVKQAIWLQTPEGMDWEEYNEEESTAGYNDEDIVEYVLEEYILNTAGSWTNKRIEKYIWR